MRLYVSHEGDTAVHRHFQRKGSRSVVKPNERVRIPREERQPKCRSVHRGRPVHTQRMAFGNTPSNCTAERAPLELNRLLRTEVLKTMLYGCVTWSPRACHYDTLRRAHHSFLARCIGWRKNNRTDHPTSYLDTLMKTGSESIEAVMRRRRILFAGFAARMEYRRLSTCVFGGGRGLRGRAEKRSDGVSPGRPQSFRYQRRTMNDCRPGRGDGERRRNTEQNVSWRNGLLQRKSGLAYGIHWCGREKPPESQPWRRRFGACLR